MDPAEVFLNNLAVIDRVIDRVCHRARVYAADAEDFASSVKLALIDDDYAILRKWEGGSLPTFLAIVVQRMLVDEWRGRGRWTASAEARRLGAAAIALETLLVRDRRPLAEAIPALQRIDPTLSAKDVEALAARLPHRNPPPRTVTMDDDAAQVFVAQQRADERARAYDAKRLSDRTSDVVRDELAKLSLEDRMLIRLRFLSSMTVADISRVMDIPQRPLYRRLEALLSQLRGKLTAAGLDSTSLAEVIGGPSEG
ncbi:MAG TPA: sigma-70 family RNA polymerase sigma factor, partial [Thermoanaerobaculia bacterium]